MQISNSSFYGASEARIKKSIEYTQSNQVLTAQTTPPAAAENAATTSAQASSSVITAADNTTRWGEISGNLGTANGGVIYTQDLSKVADLAVRDATSALDEAFAQAGISNTPPVTFTLSKGDGSLVVGDHPQKKQIEALLASNRGLSSQVREAFVLKDQAVSTEKGSIYAEAYQRTYASKGKAAADALTKLFLSLNNETVTFRYGQSGVETLYGGKSDTEYLASISGRLGLAGSVNIAA